jgi:hypothetical protein
MNPLFCVVKFSSRMSEGTKANKDAAAAAAAAKQRAEKEAKNREAGKAAEEIEREMLRGSVDLGNDCKVTNPDAVGLGGNIVHIETPNS